jgi:ferric-dicitrate binding protein FerR (iron transport regulator)
MTPLTEAQQVLLAAGGIGFASGVLLSTLVATALGRKRRRRHQEALEYIESLSVALRACAAPRLHSLPPLPPQRPLPRADREWATTTARLPVISGPWAN